MLAALITLLFPRVGIPSGWAEAYAEQLKFRAFVKLLCELEILETQGLSKLNKMQVLKAFIEGY